MKALTVIAAVIVTFMISATAFSNTKPVVEKALANRGAQIELALEAAQ